LENRSIAERFGIPHAFNPDLTPRQALISVAGALARILLGSTLFALWGVMTARILEPIQSRFLQVVVFSLLVLVFLLLFVSLMLAIAAAVRRLFTRVA